MLSTNVVKDIFEIEHGRSLSDKEVEQEAQKWMEEVEKRAGELEGKDHVEINSIRQAADIIIRGFPYRKLADYPGSGDKNPPCSILQTVNGGPLNCVGRIASLVLIAEIKDLDEGPLSSLRIEFNVDYKQKPEGGRKVEGGHITAFMKEGGSKDYLGTRYDSTVNKDYPIRMLPATYAVQNAMARGGLEGKEKLAKKMAKEAMQLGADNSMYLSYEANRLINY